MPQLVHRVAQRELEQPLGQAVDGPGRGDLHPHDGPRVCAGGALPDRASNPHVKLHVTSHASDPRDTRVV